MDIPLSHDKYVEYKTWGEFFPDANVNLRSIKFHHSWFDMFEKLFNDKKFANIIEKKLSDELKEDLEVIIHPAPELIFNAFLLTRFDTLSVVIIGQDPYFLKETCGGITVQQAMGLSFSVPHGLAVPSSLDSVYRNMLKNGHVTKRPTHGNLEFLALQGVLWLNSALTVKDGRDNVGCHLQTWSWFTDAIIRYISANKEHVVFVLWGKHAVDKMSLIDTDKHDVVVSTHPAGQSCATPQKWGLAFNDVDHFGKINGYLEKKNKEGIVWQV